MQFQTEIPDTERIKSFLNHRQSRLLFRHEQNPLPIVKRVGYHVCNRLRFTRPRRAVQNKALARLRHGNRIPLRRVRKQGRERGFRQHLVFLGKFFIPLSYNDGIFQQSLDDFVLGKLFDVLTQVVPHLIARKGECRYVHVIVHRPIAHTDHFHTYHC